MSDAQGALVPIGTPIYNQILQFLYVEARLLDETRLKEWGETLAQDLIYTAPLRETRPVSQQAASVVRTMQHYHDDWRSVMGLLRAAASALKYALPRTSAISTPGPLPVQKRLRPACSR